MPRAGLPPTQDCCLGICQPYNSDVSPKVTPGYWQCPRCNSKNFYFAPRPVGQGGFGRGFEIGDVEVVGGFARGFEQDVSLCKDCGERMKWIAEVRIYSKEEEAEASRKVNLFCLFAGILSLAFLLFIFSTAPTLEWDIYSKVLLLFGLVLFVTGAFGLLKKEEALGNGAKGNSW